MLSSPSPSHENHLKISALAENQTRDQHGQNVISDALDRSSNGPGFDFKVSGDL